MYRTFFLIVLFFAFAQVKAQRDTFVCVFEPECVTYNASNKPSQCVEAVDCGLLILEGNYERFFLLPAREYEVLKTDMVGKQITVEVIYFEHAINGSGAAGNVQQIMFDGKVIFQNVE